MPSAPASGEAGGPLGRRELLLGAAAGPASGWLLGAGRASAEEPSQAEFLVIAGAFAELDADPDRAGAREALEKAEATLGEAIARFEGPLNRSQEERAALRLGRARARVLQNDLARGTRPEKAALAVEDLDVVVGIMEDDFKSNPGKALYSEYPDALVRRGLAKEELKEWQGAVDDYSRAIAMWRPREGEEVGMGVNPLVLNFRGNALSQLRQFEPAVLDYEEAAAMFRTDGLLREASISLSNAALALYGSDREDEAVILMQDIVRKDPGITDMHVALAAVNWGAGKVGKAESEWQFACERINTGCQAYKDADWVANIRRWPPTLAAKLQNFLSRSSGADALLAEVVEASTPGAWSFLR